MTSLLSAELAATCSALGYYDDKTNKYYADSNTLETVKDLIRYLRRDDDTHDIRRQLGDTQVLKTDLIPLLKSYWEQTDLFDVLLRLLVNLTTPALMLWNEELPVGKTERNYYLQIEDHLKNYKQAFADETFWAVLSARISKILETDYSERGDENSLIIERILILIRNILYVTPDPSAEKRPDNDASVHDQVLWALHQSGMLDIILYITSSPNEKAYYLHTLEILSFMLREQKASELAHAALQRSETEKVRDEAELLARRYRETNQRRQKIKMYTGARHSRFGGTYVLKSMKSISDNELIYHKPLNKLEALNFDADKRKPKTAKNRMPVKSSTFERRSAFTIRLFLKEFCVEFLNGAYNTLMYHVKDNLVRARAQAHDESYYLWALRFFMEFNRCYKFEVKLVSETMSLQTFRYVQQLMENYFDLITTDKKKVNLWSRRLHLALLAYRELLLTITVMDKSPDLAVRESAKVIKNNLFYVLEYRELIVTLLITYDELKMSNMYLKDLLETQHIFLKMLESFCGTSSVVVQKKTTKRGKKKKATKDAAPSQPDVNLESQWDEVAPQLSTVLEGITEFATEVVPFDAASDVPIDEQKTEAMKNVQRKLRNGEFENAVGLLRAAREVWPEDNCFGSNNMAPEEEFLALREIFFADLGENDISPVLQEQPVYDEHDEEEDEDEDTYRESDFKFEEFARRLANPKIVRACGLALQDFESNSVNTNHCIVKLLHRIAFDCKLYVMVFQVSIFRSFQKIFANKDFPQYRELVKFATYIIRQFLKVADVNKKVYMESLFWKTSAEAYEVEYGYGGLEKKVPKGAWSEEQEDELRRLFMEHQQNQLEDDVVDWIVNNLIDNTRTRRGVLKKLKEMCLLVKYKGRRKSGAKARIPRRDKGDGEETQLPELYEQFKDAAEPLKRPKARKRQSKSTRTSRAAGRKPANNEMEIAEVHEPTLPPNNESESSNSDSESSDNEGPVQTKNVILSDKQIRIHSDSESSDEDLNEDGKGNKTQNRDSDSESSDDGVPIQTKNAIERVGRQLRRFHSESSDDDGNENGTLNEEVFSETAQPGTTMKNTRQIRSSDEDLNEDGKGNKTQNKDSDSESSDDEVPIQTKNAIERVGRELRRFHSESSDDDGNENGTPNEEETAQPGSSMKNARQIRSSDSEMSEEDNNEMNLSSRENFASNEGPKQATSIANHIRSSDSESSNEEVPTPLRNEMINSNQLRKSDDSGSSDEEDQEPVRNVASNYTENGMSVDKNEPEQTSSVIETVKENASMGKKFSGKNKQLKKIEESEDETDDELRETDAKRTRTESDDEEMVFKPGAKRSRLISSDED